MADIYSVRTWWNETHTEKRVYVLTTDSREGCKYVTGNRWQPKGTVTGKLTADEWQAAKALAYRDGKWTDYRQTRQPVQQPVQQPAQPAASEPERVTVATMEGKRAVGTFVLATGNVVLVAINTDHDPDAGWVTFLAEPTASERASDAFQAMQAQADAADAAEVAQRAHEQMRADLALAQDPYGYWL